MGTGVVAWCTGGVVFLLGLSMMVLAVRRLRR